MLTFLMILIILACALLIIIILAQNPKGGGLSNIGAGATQFFGARQTADFLEKATWYFGIGVFAVVVFTYFLSAPTAEGRRFKVEDATYTAPLPPAAGPEQQQAPLDLNNLQPAEQPANDEQPAQ